MTSLLREEIRQKSPFRSPQEEAFLNLQRTANLQLQALAKFLKPFQITPTQYNALRILRGSHPESLACNDVGERMVTPVPDVTRLFDRLEKASLIRRSRDLRDRRIVRAEITVKGRRLLATIDEPLDAWLRELMTGLSPNQMKTLTRSLERLRRRP